METEIKKATNNKDKKEKKEDDLISEFKEELKKDLANRVHPTVWFLVVIILIIFGSLGFGMYQIFVKPEKIEKVKESSQKIENMPEAETKVTPEQPKTEPETTQPTPTPTPAPAEPTVTEYTVVEGDTWSSIANANEMASDELMKYNGATNEDLQIGQKVKIPKN